MRDPLQDPLVTLDDLSANQASEYASEYGAHGAGERESHMSKRSRPGKCI